MAGEYQYKIQAERVSELGDSDMTNFFDKCSEIRRVQATGVD